VTQSADNDGLCGYSCKLQGDQHLNYVDYDTLVHFADRWELFGDGGSLPTADGNDIMCTDTNIMNSEITSSIIDL